MIPAFCRPSSAKGWSAAGRLTQEFHEHHRLAQATLHVHLDHDSCLEVTVLKGKTVEVKEFADRVISERGVRHGHVTYMPADVGTRSHR